MIINVNEDKLFAKRNLQDIFPHEFANRWLIKQFITYVMNNFFEKSHEKAVSSYIGDYVKNIDGETCYINEPTQERQLNQLVPFVKFGDTITNYENLISSLHTEGCLVDNTNKLLTGKHFSWCPLINIDMFINYNHYYWMGSNELEKDAIILKSPIDVERDIIGKPEYTYYDKKESGERDYDSKVVFKNGDVVVFLKDKSKSYSKTPYIVNGIKSDKEKSKIKLLPISTPLFFIDGQTNIVNDIIGQTNYHYKDEEGYGKSFDFINGMRIVFLNDVNVEYNNRYFIVDGVGESIKFIEDTYTGGFEPNYHTIERGSVDNNRWSYTNRWVHKSVLEKINVGSISISKASGYVEYDENKTYNYGDVVIYNDSLYMCMDEQGSELGHFETNDWKFLTTLTLKHAEYPIICFNKNLELYNHGTKFVSDIDYAIENKSIELNGKDEPTVKKLLGIPDKDLPIGTKILCLGNELVDGQIFVVNKFSNRDSVSIILREEDVATVKGDCVFVKNSSKKFAETMLHYNGINWVESQMILKNNQSPLFNLYDFETESLSNEVIYPKTTFNGSKLFDYMDYESSVDTTYISEIDRFVNNEELTEYNFRFNNHMTTDVIKYTPYNEYETEIKGYKFAKSLVSEEYLNDWHVSNDMDTTYLKTRFISNVSGECEIKLLYTINKDTQHEPLIIQKNGEMIYETNGDYIFDENKITIFNVEKNDVLDIKFLTSDSINSLDDGYVFEQPLSISVNQTNDNIETIAYNNCFDQMIDIIQHQVGFAGSSYGNNNYSSISHNLSVGTKIVQHSESVLKTMFLLDNTTTSIRNAIEYSMNAYAMFKLKFENVVNNMYKQGKINDFDFNADNTEQIETVIKEVIDKINLGKEGLMPYYNNGVIHLIENAYVPSTPAYLGLTGCYEPRIEKFRNHFKDEMPYVIINHDGSFRNVTNTIKDAVFLRLEKLIYDSIHYKLKDKKNGVNKLKYLPGKFRNTIYSRKDVLDLYSQYFNMWSHLNDLDYAEHYSFDYNLETNENAWKTWNYTHCKDIDGEELHGSYRAVYTHYYDTYRPDTHPWEMLGFDDKPTWWEQHYGVYPYTSMNKIMWKDIENGIIRDGLNKGEYNELKRPGLCDKFMPVNEIGKLKNPMDIGIIEKIPFIQNARKQWGIGDMGETEFIYHQTSEYRYIKELVMYLMRPCEWVETNWNTIDREVIFENTSFEQVINKDTKYRETNKDITIHNEVVNGKYIRNIGMQQWISDILASENKDITNYIEQMRNISISLGYRCAGYYKKDSLSVFSDAYGEIPEENIHSYLFKSRLNDVKTYSGIKIIKSENGFIVEGFDKTYPYFKTRVPMVNGSKASVEEGGATVFYYNQYTDEIKHVPYKTEFKTIQDTYTFVNAYAKYLEDNEGWYFTTQLPSGEISNFRTSSKSFLPWANAQVGSETNGNVILLNPGSYGLGNYHKGMVDSLNDKICGRCPIVDIEGQPIKASKISLMRNPYNTYIDAKDNKLAMVKFASSEYENALLFDNTTIFGDTLYDPKYSTVTTRLKLMGVKVSNWYGSLYAPGYIVTENGAIENYDKKASDLQYIFDVDDVRCSGLYGDYSRNVVGFEKTKVFKELFQNNKSMFDFYKGSISEKGTPNSINKLNRSTHISSTGDDIVIHENWLFKAGEFGYTADKSVIEFLLDTNKLNKNTQIITLETQVSNYYDSKKVYHKDDIVVYNSYRYQCIDENKNDNIAGIFDLSKWKQLAFVGNYIIYWDDANWIKKPLSNTKPLMDLTDNRFMNPTAGYAHINECKFIVADETELQLQKFSMVDGDTVWVVKKENGDWDILRKTGINKLVSLRFPTINDAYVQKRISNVYHFKDDKMDYYTDVTEKEAKDNPSETKIYKDIDLEYSDKTYADIGKPEQVKDVHYLYENGYKHKIKMNNSVFETLVSEEDVERNSMLWYLGIPKEEMAFPYSDTLLKMKAFGKDLYDYQYRMTVKTPSNVKDPVLTINGIKFNSKNSTVTVNTGEMVEWKMEAFACEPRSGTYYIEDINNISNPMEHTEELDITVPMNYKPNTVLSEHKSPNEFVLPLTSAGTYRVELVSGGAGASGGTYHKGVGHNYRRTGNGGSSGGHAVVEFTITQDILNENRTFVIKTGGAGKGGSCDRKWGKQGTSGGSTYFGYYNGSELVKICEVLGGTSNYGARNCDASYKAEDGRPLCQGGYLDMALINSDIGKKFAVKIITNNNGVSVAYNVHNGGKIFSKDGVSYGYGGDGVYKKDGRNGGHGYSLLKYVGAGSETINNDIISKSVKPYGKKFTHSDSKEHVAYYQKFVDTDNYFYSYDIMYRDETNKDNISDALRPINPSSLFYKNRCKSITAKHKTSVIKNAYINIAGTEFNIGDTTTYNEKYYICETQHIGTAEFVEKETKTDESGNTYDVVYWSEYTPTYYYKITDNAVDGNNVTDPINSYRLYEDKDCEIPVSMDTGTFYMTCGDLQIPDKVAQKDEFDKAVGDRYYLVDLMCSYSEIEPKYINEPTWELINHNGYYPIVSGGIEYYVKICEEEMNLTVETYNSINSKLLTDISDEERNVLEQELERCKCKMFLYSDNNCQNIAQRKVFVYKENKKDEELTLKDMLYTDIINVTQINYGKSYEYKDNDLLLYSTYEQQNIEDDTKMYFDPDLKEDAGVYSDYMPIWSKETETNDEGLQIFTDKDLIVNVIEHLKEDDIIYIDNDCYNNRNAGGRIYNSDGIDVAELLVNNRIQDKRKNVLGVLNGNSVFAEKNTIIAYIIMDDDMKTLYTYYGEYIGYINEQNILFNSIDVEIGYVDKNNIVYIGGDIYGLLNGNSIYTTGNEIIGNLTDDGEIYIDGEFKGTLTYNIKRVSDTMKIGSEYGKYTLPNEYSWIKVKYLGDGYLEDAEQYKFDLVDIENKCIDIDSIESIYIIEDKNDRTLTNVQLYDPIQNIIPNNVLDEVSYISSTDPVVNYNDNGKWSNNNVGKLWWDTSKVRYVDYHQGDLKYKLENWGKQLIGSQIVINEWYRDITPPTDDRKYVTKTIYNENTNSFETYYYYWLKNPTIIPELTFRTTSAYNIARTIASPSDMGIVWMAPMNLVNGDTSKVSFIVGEYNNVLIDDDCTIQININKKNVSKHIEWAKISENTNQDIPPYLWNKMRESILGYKVIDGTAVSVPDVKLTSRNKLGISNRPRQTMFKDTYNAKRNFIEIINQIFEGRTIDDISKDVSSELVSIKDTFESRNLTFDYECMTKLEMLSWNDDKLVGCTVLVHNDETHDNIWVLYRIDSTTNGENGYTVIDYQKYDIKPYLRYKDWYKDEEVKSIIPTYTVKNVNEISSLLDTLDIGRIVKHVDGDEWKLYQKVRNVKSGIIETCIVGISNTLLNVDEKIYDYVNQNNDNEFEYINGQTKYQYIENETNILLEKIFDYFEKN